MKNSVDYISEKFKVEKSQNIIVQNIKDEIIILNQKTEMYLGLDSMGVKFWNALLDTDSVKDAYNKLLDEFDVDPEILEKDLNSFISKINKSGLVQLIPKP